jgi:hypothetical protein
MIGLHRGRPVAAGLLLSALFYSSPGEAQELGVAPHLGTLGLGADLAVRVAPSLGIRVGANYFPFDISFDEDSVDYTLELPSPQFLVAVDYYPAGQFRLTGGLMVSASSLDLTAELVGPREIGDGTYTPEEVGSLTGTLDTRTVSLYAGIGFGDPTARRVGFFLDAGVAFHGNPDLDVEAHGPLASDPDFQADLDAEVDERQDDVENFSVYPVLSVGLSFRL